VKKIIDYINFYLGCEVTFPESTLGAKYTIAASMNGTAYLNMAYKGRFSTVIQDIRIIKPLLRKMDSITEDECKNLYYNIYNEYHKGMTYKSWWLDEDNEHYTTNFRLYAGEHRVNAINYLRSISIDMDGLIDAGLAIDKETIK